MAKPGVFLRQSELTELVEESLEFWSTNKPILVLVIRATMILYIEKLYSYTMCVFFNHDLAQNEIYVFPATCRKLSGRWVGLPF